MPGISCRVYSFKVMDVASSDLNAATLPIPSEMRVFVFLASGRDPDMEREFLKCGGKSEFYSEPEDAAKCGICLFRRGFGAVSLIQPFFDRAGKESNIFYFDSMSRRFVRIGLNWLEMYATVAST